MTKENIHFDNISFELGTAGAEASHNYSKIEESCYFMYQVNIFVTNKHTN